MTTDDAKGKGLIKEGSSSGRPPHSALLLLIGGIGRLGSSVRIVIGVNNKRGSGKNEISIKITGIAHSSFIVGKKISNCRLFETVLSAMVIIGTTGHIRNSRTMTDVLMGQLGGERQSMISWGVGLVCMTGLVNVSAIFQGIRRNLQKWQMHGVPDEFIFCRDANIHRVESKEVCY